jgi:hypothetical protein
MIGDIDKLCASSIGQPLDGKSVGCDIDGYSDGEFDVGDLDGDIVGTDKVGDEEGIDDGTNVGSEIVGDTVGDSDGLDHVGDTLGDTLGVEVVGAFEGNMDGAIVGHTISPAHVRFASDCNIADVDVQAVIAAVSQRPQLLVHKVATKPVLHDCSFANPAHA